MHCTVHYVQKSKTFIEHLHCNGYEMIILWFGKQTKLISCA